MFVTVHLLCSFVKAIEVKVVKQAGYEPGPASTVEFLEKEIHLDIPERNCNGWKMRRLNPLVVLTYIDLEVHKS